MSHEEDGGELDPVVAVVLMNLWDAAAEAGGKPWSLAKLSKRADVAMSTLRRTLTQLAAAGLVDVDIDDAGRGSARLTDAGRELGDAIARQTGGGAPDAPGAAQS